jgi:multidrug efflux pump
MAVLGAPLLVTLVGCSDPGDAARSDRAGGAPRDLTLVAPAGALLGLYLSGATLNIYSQIGIVMLIGIAAKNGVLIFEFINQMRDAGRGFEEAIVEAAIVRLRPVVMTTLSTSIGALPLLFALGAVAESRNVLGAVIFSGVMAASLLTLFVVPAFYHLLARRTSSPKAVADELDRLTART